MIIDEFKINTPVIVSKFKLHDSIKHKTLSLIDSFTDAQEKIFDNTDSITKTDWNSNEDIEKDYQSYIKPYLINHTAELFKNYNSLGIRFGNLWFQQYDCNNKHDWHIHGLCHFTNVYFLELGDLEIKTEIKDVYGNIINYSATEGDILSFPSFLYHRSPTNNSKNRKTVISFNINFL
jgi:hypothetical protein